MNTTQLAHLSAQVNAAARHDVESHCATALVVLLMWYHLTTIDREVDFLRGRRSNAVLALFLANRYLPLVVVVYRTSWYEPIITHAGCAAFIVCQFFLTYSENVFWGLFSALRVYALRQQRLLAALVLFLSLFPAFTNAIPVLFMHIIPEPGVHCSFTFKMPTVVTLILYLSSRLALVLADGIVAVITILGTRQSHRNRVLLGKSSSLASVLYTDGSLYFVILTVLNIVHLLLSVFSAGFANLGNASTSILGRFIEPINAILMTQFIFDLHEAAYGSGTLGVHSLPRTITTVDFARADVDRLRMGTERMRMSLHGTGSFWHEKWAEECLEALEEVRCVARSTPALGTTITRVTFPR